MDLDETLTRYFDLQKKLDELKKESDSLKFTIINEMEQDGVLKFETKNGLKANLTYKDLVKYSDEPALIKYCEENKLDQYVTKKVNATMLNKDLKKSETLVESLHPYFTINQSKVLTVKGE